LIGFAGLGTRLFRFWPIVSIVGFKRRDTGFEPASFSRARSPLVSAEATLLRANKAHAPAKNVERNLTTNRSNMTSPPWLHGGC
jgi:hypothetical protein